MPEYGITNYKLSVRRRAKDKTINSKGRKFLDLCEERGLVILNGRTPGDCEGEYTYISSTGASTNDIVAVSYGLTSCISNFEIINQPYSDHLPLSLRCHMNLENNTLPLNNEMKLVPKLEWKNQKEDQYKIKLERAVNDQYSEANLDDLMNAIHESSVKTLKWHREFKREWFDNACFKARKRSFKWLNMYRKHNTDFEKRMYMLENKNFKNLCKTKRKAYFEELSHKLSSSRDSKEFWSLIRKLRGTKFTKGNDITIDNFRSYFENLLNPPMNPNMILYAAPHTEDIILDGEITLNELTAALKKAKDNKAPGPDRIPYEFFKHAPPAYLNKLVKVFNDIYQNGNIPESFSNSIIFPIYKKGDPNLPENYRGLSFMDAVAKLLTGIINRRLVLWEESNSILHESQAGFRSGYSTVDNIFNLYNIINIKLAKRKRKVYAFFVDFKAAFDTINRAALFYKLSQIGVSTKCIKFLQCLYRTTSAQVWNGEKLSEKFYTNSGLRQGCLLSPILFSLFINDIEDIIEGGVNIDGLIVKILLYADDLVLFAEDPVQLQQMINKLDEFCQQWNLIVNLNKSKIMIFKNGGGKRATNEKWTYRGTSIEVVGKYKYLGITLTPKLSLKDHLKDRLSAAKGALNSTWSHFIGNANITHSSKFRIYTSALRSVLCYAAQVWGFREYEEVEKLQRFFIKKLFRLPQITPNYVLTLETGLPNSYIFTLKCHFEYMAKVLNMYAENRLPYILAKKTIENKIYWYEEWMNLAEKHNVVELMEQATLSALPTILEKEERWHWLKAQERARQTVRHGLYDKLNYNFGDLNYFNDNSSIAKIRQILLYRSGLLQLNASPWRVNGTSMCSLCNLQEDEDFMHYLAICPILKEFRILAFGKTYLTENECISILNGGNFEALYEYAKLAWRYRHILIEEFNS